MKRRLSHRALLLQGTLFSVLTLPFAVAAMAQTSTEPTSNNAAEQIVVTGTSIRGVAAVGADPITISTEQIKEAPGFSTNAVLATIPQLNVFNEQLGVINGGLGAANQIEMIQVHGLPTLILLDGHRVAPAGSTSTSIDPSIIPKGVLNGIEVVPDGGSAIYGSDAIGGVINFTTKKRFNGVDVDGDVSLLGGGQEYRLNATIGKEWDKGSIYLGYAFDKQTPIFGRDRPYLTYHNSAPGVVNVGCEPSGVTVGSGATAVTYNPTGIGANGKPTGYTTPAANCNPFTNESIISEEHEHSLFGGWSQDITQWLSVDTRAFYSKRDSNADQTTNTQNNPGTAVKNTNFYFTPVGAETSQTVGFSLTNNQPVPSRSDLQTWGISSTATADLGHDFQARLLGSYSKSNFKLTNYVVDSTLLAAGLAGTTQATALDPYDPLVNAQSALVAHEIDGDFSTATGQTDEYQARLTADGPLFHIPGGDVKIAAGGEVLRDIAHLFSTVVNYLGTPTSGNPQVTGGARTVTSAFGELNVPLVSPDNNVALIHRLDFSAAGRFDHYSDFGNTFNPRLALSYLPNDWLTFRGTWGHSFIAPQLYNEFQPGTVTINTGFPGFTLPAGDFADFLAGKINVNIQGGNPNLKPEKSRTYTLGGDLKVPFVDGLKLSLTYYNTQYTANLLSAFNTFTGTGLLFTPAWASFVTKNPTLAQVQAATAGLPVSGVAGGQAITNVSQLYGPGGAIIATSPIYLLNLGYGNNSGLTHVSGVDFDVSYRHPVSFGSVNFSVGGNYNLENKSNQVPTGPYTDNLANVSVFRGIVSAGADAGDFHGTATLLHTGGYSLPTGSSFLGQTHVSSYNLVNTSFSYTLNGDYGMATGTELRFGIDNLLNARPATDLASGNANGLDRQSLLGRIYELGFHKKF